MSMGQEVPPTEITAGPMAMGKVNNYLKGKGKGRIGNHIQSTRMVKRRFA